MEGAIGADLGAYTATAGEESRRAKEGETRSSDAISSDLLLPTVLSIKRSSHLLHSVLTSHLPHSTPKENPSSLGRPPLISESIGSSAHFTLDSMMRIKSAVLCKEQGGIKGLPYSQGLLKEHMASAVKLHLTAQNDQLRMRKMREGIWRDYTRKLLGKIDSYRRLLEECEDLLAAAQSLGWVS